VKIVNTMADLVNGYTSRRPQDAKELKRWYDCSNIGPTFTSPVGMTAVGMIVGTATYMSPEQARGRPADKRSDVWAFGCVLYEMLAGRRPFDGADVSEVLALVITKEPEWGGLPVSTPSSLRRLLRRCLEKDPRGAVTGDSAVAASTSRRLTVTPDGPSTVNQGQ
jgi:serine/threonine protein kinase